MTGLNFETIISRFDVQDRFPPQRSWHASSLSISYSFTHACEPATKSSGEFSSRTSSVKKTSGTFVCGMPCCGRLSVEEVNETLSRSKWSVSSHSSEMCALTHKGAEGEHFHITYGRRRPDYFCRRNLWRKSGQNSLTRLLRLAASSCDAQFTAVLCKLRSCGG